MLPRRRDHKPADLGVADKADRPDAIAPISKVVAAVSEGPVVLVDPAAAAGRAFR